MFLRRLRDQRGDTIVEVLLATSIIGAIVGTAFAIVASNIRTETQAQQRDSAVQIAQNEIEYLRINGQPTLAIGDTMFCFYQSGGNVSSQTFSHATYNPPVTPLNDTLTGNYPSNCTLTTTSTPGVSQPLYYTSVRVSATTPVVYTISVRWFSQHQGVNNVTLYYGLN